MNIITDDNYEVDEDEVETAPVIPSMMVWRSDHIAEICAERGIYAPHIDDQLPSLASAAALAVGLHVPLRELVAIVPVAS